MDGQSINLIPVLAAVISSIAACLVGLLSLWASHRSSINSLTATQRQIDLQTVIKSCEFRQAWINSLRDSMAEFQAIGITPDTDAWKDKEFYKYGTKIELLMNRNDQDYAQLQGLMYRFLRAKTLEDKFSCNAEFINLCQNILKREWEVLKKELYSVARSRQMR